MRPEPTEQKRDVKWELVLVNSLTFFPAGLIVGNVVDFVSGAIYRPVRNEYGTKLMTKAEEKAYRNRVSEEISKTEVRND